ncbi:carboxymuconolactone decarboxylase family protein [Erythrobacter mangrovi]|uniref:Carboxymuconolactone decarboxylase family protein n=1 Tax=Erythrobacter mangrovi TaxID=2739433 RepID=A0A7D3XHF2_9SPHN|nr:carboxymuconolactone decarboxylase family protein [Erythrobacter mangrovi]QKG70419.1 carboxymuconolactone decarboxylase family protein [Erythrobacter mangrovi]
MQNRLAPLEEPYPEDVAKLLEAYPKANGQILSLFRTFANSGRFLKKGVANFLDKESPLPLRIREIVILRVTALFGCEYEWGVHTAIFAAHAKFDDRQLADLASAEATFEAWPSSEAALIKSIDQLCRTGRLDDAAQASFEVDWSVEQQLEIIAIVGAYHTVSMVANVARLPLEGFARPFPE